MGELLSRAGAAPIATQPVFFIMQRNLSCGAEPAQVLLHNLELRLEMVYELLLEYIRGSMSPEQFNFLVNAGVAGLFAMFALLLTDKFTKQMDRQAELWREFLIKEREHFATAIGRIAEEVKANNIAVTENRIHLEKLREVLDKHDLRVVESIPGMREAMEKTQGSPAKRTR